MLVHSNFRGAFGRVSEFLRKLKLGDGALRWRPPLSGGQWNIEPQELLNGSIGCLAALQPSGGMQGMIN
jgi:hypothetical protein